MKKNRSYIFAIVVLLSILACSLPTGGSGNQPGAQSNVQGKPLISAPGIAGIKLHTNIEGAGTKPLFAWDAVSGASRYQLIVFDEAGDPYWAWEGAQTQIYMGGTDAQPPADSSGPSIVTGYSWTVMAYDSNGKILAASDVRPVSP